MTFSGGVFTFPIVDWVGGWEFSVSTTITVDGLGFWDDDSDGLDHDHDVGLWTLAGDLLDSATVSNAAAAPEANSDGPGRWLFVDMPERVLEPGAYVLGATFQERDSDRAAYFPTRATIPGVNYVARRSEASSVLTFPTEVWDDNIFGPNLRLAVPELSPADFDEDGDVDGDDFLIWQQGFANDGSGDADNDGDTDGDDFLVWQQEFGSGAGAVAAPTPEPSAFLLATLGVTGLLARRRYLIRQK